MHCPSTCHAHFGNQCNPMAKGCVLHRSYPGPIQAGIYEITRTEVREVNLAARIAIEALIAKGVPTESIYAAIPVYYAQACSCANLEPYVNPAVNMFYGVQTFPGYENAIVIFFREGLTYDIEPTRIPIRFIKKN
jgi:hypothetical protein